MKNPYEDIINLPHHVSSHHPQMSLENRAAQFAPFAALTGYGSAVTETARLTDKRITLEENAMEQLGIRLNILQEEIDSQPEIEVTYFLPDQKKEGGAYVTATGSLKKIDDYEGVIVFVGGEKVPLDDIVDIDCELFKDLI
jgi:Cation/multidrug efflux pump